MSEGAPARRVLVTGAGGYIGRPTVEALASRGAQVIATARNPAPASWGETARVESARLDLLSASDDAVRETLASAEASALVHLAWDVSPGFWTSSANLNWLEASIRLIRLSAEAGIKRIVIAGTCAEYDWSTAEGPLSERFAPCAPHTLYGVAKLSLWRVLEGFAAARGLSVASGRVFFPIGPGEHAQRLVTQVATALLSEEGVAAVTEGRQRRDFIDVRDTGAAFAALALSGVEGPVNIGRGEALPVRDVVEAVHAALGGRGRVAYGARSDQPNDPPLVLADAARLRDEVGVAPAFSPSDSVRDTVATLG